MMHFLVKGGVVCLCLISLQPHAETFLNYPALVNQAGEQGRGATQDVKAIEPRPDEQYNGNIEVSISSSSPRLQSVDPGFTPSHEVMRETEAKREANDRLWQAIFSVF